MNRAALEKLADKLLTIIRSKPRNKFRISALARKLKAADAEIAKALVVLKEWGYRFNRSRDAVIFRSAPDTLNATEIGYKLRSRFIGKKIHSYNSVKSTNDIANQLAERKAIDGTIITAEKQTLGRGRLGRSWHSPEKMGIYVSIILRPKFPPDKAPGLSVMTALAVAETISDYCSGRVQIKWPNDILINNRKAAGVLTELSASRNSINYVIVGVGINANQKSSDFPKTIRKTATSVRCASRRKINRAELLSSFLSNFEKEYVKYQKHGLTKSLARIRRRLSLTGKNVKLQTGKSSISGTAVDIDKTGALVIDQDGIKVIVASGEVTVVK